MSEFNNLLTVTSAGQSTTDGSLRAIESEDVPLISGYPGTHSASPPPPNITPVSPHPGSAQFGQRADTKVVSKHKSQGKVKNTPGNLTVIRKPNRPKKQRFCRSENDSIVTTSSSAQSSTPSSINVSEVQSEQLSDRLRKMIDNVVFNRQRDIEEGLNNKIMDLRPSRFVSGLSFRSYRSGFKPMAMVNCLLSLGLGKVSSRLTCGLLDIYPPRVSTTEIKTGETHIQFVESFERSGFFETVWNYMKGYYVGCIGYFSSIFYIAAAREFWNSLPRYRDFEIEPVASKLPIEDLRCDQLAGINIKHQDAQLAVVRESKSFTMWVDDLINLGDFSKTKNYQISLELLSQITGPNHFVYGQDIADTIKLMSNTARHFATINYSRYEYLMQNYGENTVHVAKHLWNHHRSMFGDSGLSF